MGQFAGYVQQESSIQLPFLTRSSTQPIDSAALPTYRVYGPAGGQNGLMNNGTGSAAFKDSGVITGATNANPIVVTSVAHGLKVGNIVTISGVGGNIAANTTAAITAVTTDTFTIGVAGNGAYTSGGTWHVTGLYTVTVSCVAADGYAASNCYTVVLQGNVNGSNWADVLTFMVT